MIEPETARRPHSMSATVTGSASLISSLVACTGSLSLIASASLTRIDYQPASASASASDCAERLLRVTTLLPY